MEKQNANSPEPEENAPLLPPPVKYHLSKVCKGIFMLTLFSLGIFFAFTRIAAFSDWFNCHISAVIRRILAFLTSWIPFSLAEALLLLLPVLLILLLILAFKKYSTSFHNASVFLARILSGALCILILFIWGFAPGYYGYTVEKKLNLERTKVSTEELFFTADLLLGELITLADVPLFPDKEKSSVMPYTLSEMTEKLSLGYEKVQAEYGFPDHFKSTVKPVMLSEPMSYTHITGVYSFFTGEANLNVNFPDYTLPFTAAHEMAHQRGVAREGEANFIAFLVCLASEDDYIRYSGILSVYEYVFSALYSANAGLCAVLNQRTPTAVAQEESAYRNFFKKYEDNTVANVSDAVNNSYLQSLGSSEGSRSYNLVVDLTVAYYRPIFS